MADLDPSMLHPEEADRLATLAGLEVFGDEVDEEFAPLLRLAARLTGTHMALVTLIGARHQWHAAVLGVERETLDRADAMCSHTILAGGIFHVPDTTKDDRFRDSPHVGVDSPIRMYAGAPLVVRGLPVGALCVIDEQARELSDDELATLRDLSETAVAMLEQRQRTRELEEGGAKLAELNAELELFAQTCAHDLKAPLAVVRGYAQLLGSRTDQLSAEQVREWATMIEERSASLAEIVNGMLAQARGEFLIGEVDLDAITSEVVLRLANAIDRARAAVDVARPLPTVVGDRLQLTRLLQNLIANAVKFSRPGLMPEVRVSATAGDDGSWRIEVADNGIGIPVDAREKVTQRGLRLAEASAYPGHGIGLDACRRIAEAHGAALEFSDTPGGGATIAVVRPPDPPSSD